MPVAGSGRTDAGVHAFAQVAAFSIENPIPVDNLRRAVNRLLPRDIRVLQRRGSRARFSSSLPGQAEDLRISHLSRRDLFAVRTALCLPSSLSAGDEEMIAAAPLLEGEHDFTAFAASDDRDELELSKVRTIFCSRLALRRRPADLSRHRKRISEAHGAEHRGRALRSREGKSGSRRIPGAPGTRLRDSGRADCAGKGVVSGVSGVLTRLSQLHVIERCWNDRQKSL